MKPTKHQVDNHQIRRGPSKPLRGRDTIASRAKRVDWQKVDDILARVPVKPPLPGDEAE